MPSPVLTPDGIKYDPHNPTTIGECWLTSSSYPNLVKYSQDPDKASFVNQYIIEACGLVNQYCKRYFNSQTIDQIYKDKVLNIREYSTFALQNRPLIAVTNVWVQVVNSFATVDMQYLQVMTREGIVKIIPTFSVYAQTTLPMYALSTSTNVWIRYTSGFDSDTIPAPVKRATAMMVDYLFGVDNLTPNVSSFRTQTYSETSAKVDEDPILTRIYSMLNPYRLSTIV